MSIAQLLSEKFATAFQTVSGLEKVDPVVQVAGRPEFGDYQVNGAMALAKSLGRVPRQLAQSVIEAVDKGSVIDSLEVAGPGFINVKLSDAYLVSQLRQASESGRLGVAAHAPERVVVDYSSVNLAKEMHVGHLRSTIIGDCIARVNEFLGHTVIRQNHVGDWGTQFGMLVAYLVESRKQNDMAAVDLSDLEAFYRKAKTRFEDPDFADMARQYVVRLQSGDAEVMALWRHFVDVSMSHCEKVYQQLGVRLTRADVRGESAYNDELPAVVRELQAAGIAQTSEGAEVVMLDEFKGKEGASSVFMVRKKDGGYLYGTTDLAAVKYRAHVLEADRCLYVVDSRQALHFQQLFAVARRGGMAGARMHMEHIAFGMVLGKDGKPFKTRAGESIKLTDLLGEAVQRAGELMTQKNPDMPRQQREVVARAVGIGAVKYSDLSKNRLSDYQFDWDSMLSFEGNTAPYLQYAYVRFMSVLRNAGSWDENSASFALGLPVERALGLHLVRFADTLKTAARDSAPHVLCAYLYELAAAFSRFYEQCPILSEGAVNVPRIKLSRLAARALEVGLGLLGIEVVDGM